MVSVSSVEQISFATHNFPVVRHIKPVHAQLQNSSARIGMMVYNVSGASHQRANLMDRGESFVIKARIIASVHGTMTGNPGDNDYATLLAIKFEFQSKKSHRRARRANVMLRFTSERTAPVVMKYAPESPYKGIRQSSTTFTSSLGPMVSLSVLFTSWDDVCPGMAASDQSVRCQLIV